MSDVFIGQIVLLGCNFAPQGFAFCQGQLLPIAQNTALFSLLGTMYGGDGTSSFALPDLRGCVPNGFGQGPGLNNYAQGQVGGSYTVTLLTAALPPHTHAIDPTAMTATAMCSNAAADRSSPATSVRSDWPSRNSIARHGRPSSE